MHPRRTIERYLAEGLPVAAEQQLRQHLRGCEACRRFYDEELLLRRALAGAPVQPTRAEDARLRRLILERAGVPAPAAAARPAPLPARAQTWRFLASPWRFAVPVGAALALLIGLWLARPGPRAPTLPATNDMNREYALSSRITQAKGTAVNGVPARAGAEVRAGATVVVAADGAAELELVRGGRVRLFPGTRLKLTPRGEVVALDEGKVWCDIEPLRGRFAVQTERGEARVLGTSFVVEKLADGDAEVRVQSGVVEVEDLEHRGIVRVKEGQRTRLGLGTAPTRAAHYDAQRDRADWEQALRKLGREVERALRKLGDQLHLP